VARGQHRLLLPEVRGAHGQDRPLRRSLVAVPLDVGLAELAFPGEDLVIDRPGAAAAALPFDHLGQGQRDPRHVVERRHVLTVPVRRGGVGGSLRIDRGGKRMDEETVRSLLARRRRSSLGTAPTFAVSSVS
jgi:hypothetical protein